MSKKVMLSAIAPSNRLTLGNYIGAIRNWLILQRETQDVPATGTSAAAKKSNVYDCLFFVVDMHAITVRQDPEILREQTYWAIALYIAAGLDPEKITLFAQSHVPQHAELAWVLNCFTYMGELSRMTQYKDKSAKQGQNIGAGLFTYPTLMAADILLYHTHLVPVGEDQKQHLEITRDVALRMNNIYGKDLFTLPEVYIPPVGARIMSLQDPSAKMSKSDEDTNSAIYLSDTGDQIMKKFKRAVTDSGTEITFEDSKPGVKNLLTIQSSLTGKPIPEIVASYAGKQYGHLKIETAEIVSQTLNPIRDKALELMKDRTHLDQVLAQGAARARERSQKTLDEVYKRIGFIAKRQH